MMATRTDQFAEVWRVALARHTGQSANLTEVAGPLGKASLGIGARNLMSMFAGKPYQHRLPAVDTVYFLNRIDQDLGATMLAKALDALEKHRRNYASTNGKQLRVRAVYDNWLAKAGNASSLVEIESTLASEVVASLALDDMARAKQSAGYDATPATRKVTVHISNPHVIAGALKRAQGSCEDCGRPAPVKRQKDGTDYLEVHHVVRLAEAGNDTPDNVLALCPNCHRKAHHG